MPQAEEKKSSKYLSSSYPESSFFLPILLLAAELEDQEVAGLAKKIIMIYQHTHY